VLNAAKPLVTGDCVLDGMVKVSSGTLIAAQGLQAMGSAHFLPVADEKARQVLSSYSRLSDPFDDLD